ncbi:MAG: hypothetical protein H7249_13565 [Chitinophagaceae bacterium]|nr:hypothetical protein [Oligoflexus sp.]
MKFKYTLTTAALLFVILEGCRVASFETKSGASALKTESGSGDGSPEGTGDSKPELPTVEATPSVAQIPLPAGAPATVAPNKATQNNPTQNMDPAPIPVKQVLTVTMPSPEIKGGGEKIQAVAKLNTQATPPVVTWAITGPADKTDIGSIDKNGVYTSPKTNDKEFPITITATLVSDPTITASTPLLVLPIDQIFARCSRGNIMFPIFAQVYSLNSTATKIPDFSNPAEATKVTTVCMDQYAVAPRNFSDGFPDVPNLFEYFALQTTTILVVPETGNYTLYINSDDGAKVSLDDKLLLDNDGAHQAYGPTSEDSQTGGYKEVTLTLTKGDHKMNLDYFQGPKYRIALELKWKTPSSSTYTYIPTANFK